MENAALIQTYRELDRDCALLHYRLNSQKQFESRPVLPTAENYDRAIKEADALIARIDSLPAPGPAFEIVRNHMSDFMHAEKLAVDNYFTKLGGSLYGITWKTEMLTSLDSRPLDVRADVMLNEIKAVGELWQGVRAGLPAQSADELSSFCSNCADMADSFNHYAENAGRYFSGLSEKRIDGISSAMKGLCADLAGYGEYARTLLPEDKANAPADDDRIVRLDESYYRAVLHDNLGVELDELLSWHESEIEKTRAEVFDIANGLPVVTSPVKSMREVNALLLRYAGPCDSPEEMMTRAAGYLERSRRVSREYVTYPEEVCRLETVPYPIRKSYPWGGYSDGDGVGRPCTGKLFLNDYNFKAVTDGWIKMNTIHEAYPGHHIQYVRTTSDPRPETIKIGAKYIPMIEGMAHRSEKVFQSVFDDDPFFPLFVAYRRHHTSVRIKCDLMLRYFGRPISECVKLYMDELDFDYATARGQVLAQERMEGYFTCYYYGMKKITDWERKLGYGVKDYTELLFSAGNISMENFEIYLKMSEAERNSYTHDFRSLLMK